MLTYPTENFGLNGNAPEIAAGVEAAVTDGMDVINLSLGEAEIDPARDLVATAINAAADAGVVPVIAAGNDYEDFGRGSVSSPGNAAKAITAAAVTKQLAIASFSSSGPTPISLGMKPDVAAPGVDITSSVPPSDGTWASFSGTSMASPHVAGAAALLLQRHPDWTVAQVKSALVLTGKPVPSAASELPTTREGGGLVQIPTANAPLIFAAPADVSFGLVRTGSQAARSVTLTDAGGGAGTWIDGGCPAGRAIGRDRHRAADGDRPRTARPDRRSVGSAPEADVTGFVVLTFGATIRRIPFWFRVESPKLGSEPTTPLTAPGLHKGQMRGKRSLVSSYRYPADARSVPGAAGPEQVFRVRLARPVANFGVVLLSSAGPTRFRPSPRVVAAGDENRLTGNAGLPLVINPYLDSFGAARPVAGAIRPVPGSYDVVFDVPVVPTAGAAGPGAYTFRYWVNDVTPPSVRLLTRTARAGSRLRLAVADAGSGVDPQSLAATVDGRDGGGRLHSRPRGDQPHRVAPGQAPRRARGRGLPGAEEHGERPADPPEHQEVHGHVRRPLAPQRRGSCSSIVGSRSRSRCTLAANSSLSSRISRSCAFWAARARFCRDRVPRCSESRGHSAATSTTTAAASRAMKSQLTRAL